MAAHARSEEHLHRQSLIPVEVSARRLRGRLLRSIAATASLLIGHRLDRRDSVLKLCNPLQRAVRRHRIVLSGFHDEIALAGLGDLGGRRAFPCCAVARHPYLDNVGSEQRAGCDRGGDGEARRLGYLLTICMCLAGKTRRFLRS